MFEKIIKEEIENLNEYFHEAWLEQLEEEQIEKFTKAISDKIGCEVVGTGKVLIDIPDLNKAQISVKELDYETCKKYQGENIQILIKVKE